MPRKKRGRGRPKGSRSKAPDTATADNSTSNSPTRVQPRAPATATNDRHDAQTPTASPIPNGSRRSSRKSTHVSSTSNQLDDHLQPSVQALSRFVTLSPNPDAGIKRREEEGNRRGLVVRLRLPAAPQEDSSLQAGTSANQVGMMTSIRKGRKTKWLTREQQNRLLNLPTRMAPVGVREADVITDNEVDGMAQQFTSHVLSGLTPFPIVALKDTIQHLFEIQAATLGYIPETQVELVNKMYVCFDLFFILRSFNAFIYSRSYFSYLSRWASLSKHFQFP